MIVFDVDGVLLDNKLGGFKDILVLLGKEKEVMVIDKEYQRRKATGPWGLEQLAMLYNGFFHGHLKATAKEYCRANLMPGAQETVQEIRKAGYYAGAISSNPQFLMGELEILLHLDFAYGTLLEFAYSQATGEIKQKVDRYVKAELLEDTMQKYGVERKQVVVVDDSITDLPMAEKAGKFIAFSPKDRETRRAADIIIEKKDLREVLKYL